MNEALASILNVKIDFSQSHLFFPTLVVWAIGLMLVAIAIIFRERIVAIVQNPAKELRFFADNADKFRLFASIALVIVYFWAMDEVGMLIPNTGMGFLICSVIFMFILSTVYAHERTKRVMFIITANALIAPTAAWFILGKLFDISLP